MKERDLKFYFGRKVAVDASTSLYQFLVAVRQNDGHQLSSADGETTSHLVGFFYRTISMLEVGLKPVYVFDGKPPEMKANELKKRGERRADAQKEMEAAKEAGDQENFDKFSRRTVKVTREQTAECQRLLKLMGVPYVEAPGEAEAQCAALAKAGKVFAAGSEDMDTLTFGTPFLLRHLTMRKQPIVEVDREKMMQGLGLTEEQFIDLCIMLGCDYCDSIPGVGPVRALALIKEHKSIEGIIKNVDKKKFPVPEGWPYEQVRELFKNPDVAPCAEMELVWSPPDEQGLIQFLVEEKGFSIDRVKSNCEKLQKLKSAGTQGRLDGFFKVVPKDPSLALKKKVDPKKTQKKTQKKK
ncbi:PIN domain-like protein [Gorgonomyces haynaldii]|nr:PIN domain-like protein [Gorgonomyces haynaldii]